MYLHDDFIKLIKSRFAYAHPGNVNQLLESFNKLAGAGVEIYLVTDWLNNREVIELYYMNKKQMIYLNDITYSDKTCVDMCKMLSTVGDKEWM